MKCFVICWTFRVVNRAIVVLFHIDHVCYYQANQWFHKNLSFLLIKISSRSYNNLPQYMGFPYLSYLLIYQNTKFRKIFFLNCHIIIVKPLLKYITNISYLMAMCLQKYPTKQFKHTYYHLVNQRD